VHHGKIWRKVGLEIIQHSRAMRKSNKEKFLMIVSVLGRNKIQECYVLTEDEMGDSSTQIEVRLNISL